MSSNLTSDINKNDLWTTIFDRFNQNIRAEADTLLKHIFDSRTNLINERDSLQSEIELLKKEKDEMTRLLKKYDQILTLNIQVVNYSQLRLKLSPKKKKSIHKNV
ncbi:unnamed protein product [Rotaria magnacalcarata]|uniref:Uncharacterized protein n=1 Tax=Rotaria magnacalcarata TaxID=392030 RepID=A0A816XGL9_9BILA|nr:unnamed protein product [Rotaria magnacalcarata]CAF2221987.1 unnamed protein product [Rotaria magnacalcarata]